MKKGKRMLERITEMTMSETLDLPGVSILEVYSDRRVLLEVHGGILEYDTDKIRIRVSFGTICICGACLKVVQMSIQQLVICGRIDGIYFNRGQTI